MKMIIYILYRYYNNGSTKVIAYESSIFGFLLILFINLFAIMQYFDLTFQRKFSEFNILWKYILVLLCLLMPGYLIISKITKKKDLKNENLEQKYKPIHGWFLFLYILFSVSFMIYAININKG